MEGIGGVDDVQALRDRLAEYDELWQVASARLAAFARLEELAEAHATTPEALALKAGAARADARRTALHAEVESLQGAIGQLAVEVAQLEQERDELLQRCAEAQRQLAFVEGELQRRTADRQSVERELGTMLALREQRSQEIAELTQSRDDLYLEVAELLDGIEDLDRGGAPHLPAATGPGISFERFDEDAELNRFDAFFNADIGHDKSRDWILSDGGNTVGS